MCEVKRKFDSDYICGEEDKKKDAYLLVCLIQRVASTKPFSKKAGYRKKALFWATKKGKRVYCGIK